MTNNLLGGLMISIPQTTEGIKFFSQTSLERFLPVWFNENIKSTIKLKNLFYKQYP